MYSHFKDFEKSESDVDEALRCNPRWQQGYTMRAGYLEDMGRHKDALVSMNRAEEIGPLNVSSLADRGVILSRLKEFKLAIADFNRVIELKPNEFGAYSCRAIAKLELNGPSQDVVSDLEKALSINPDDKNTRELLSSVRKSLSKENPSH